MNSAIRYRVGVIISLCGKYLYSKNGPLDSDVAKWPI